MFKVDRNSIQRLLIYNEVGSYLYDFSQPVHLQLSRIEVFHASNQNRARRSRRPDCEIPTEKQISVAESCML